MDYLLLPHYRGDLPTSIPKVPYVCSARYDGTPFLSYPAKVGRPEAGDAWFDQARYKLLETFSPSLIPELESFLQTWLFFGLIAEAMGATNGDLTTEPSSTPEPNLEDDSAKLTYREVLDRLYRLVLVERENGACEIVLDAEGLQTILDMTKARWPSSDELQQKRYDYLGRCIRCAYNILKSVPQEFNHDVKFSIIGLLELFSQSLQRTSKARGLKYDIFQIYTPEYFNEDVRQDMMNHGWCPNDIERTRFNFQSLQLSYISRMMDKSLPRRDHSTCTSHSCKYFQINMAKYQLQHQIEGCGCGEALVDSNELTEILEKEDKFVLLRFVGDDDNLRVELVESEPDSSYVAISHVWADGLGNPFENSLYRCKLHHLRSLVSAIKFTGEQETLIWLDTLCCPAKDGPGKRLAIEKIRLVYQNARCVLVLDAGLMPYESLPQTLPEKAMRIFTSGWMRRLWTLQEGALARSLYFQFADEAISLFEVRLGLFQLSMNSARHYNFLLNIWRQFLRLEGFFPGENKLAANIPRLTLLDEALLYRSVTVSTDEALCIGTLMCLDLRQILSVEPKEDRMRKVWELIGKTEEGIPAHVIFLEESKLEMQGWRWALKSFLQPEKVLLYSTGKFVRTTSLQKGKIDPRGLRVQFSGYRIKCREYDDSKPPDPWPGLPRVAEYGITFVDEETGKRYQILDKSYALSIQDWKTADDRINYNNSRGFPLHDLANKNRAGIVTATPISAMGRASINTVSGIFGTVTDSSETLGGGEQRERGLIMESRFQVVVNTDTDDHNYLYTVFKNLAHEARNHIITDRYLAQYERLEKESRGSKEMLEQMMLEDEEYNAVRAELKQYFIDITQVVIDVDERFVKAVKTHMGDVVESVWVKVREWFREDYIGERVDDEQVWFVD
ncbi:hypothetical protein NHQ30_009800 [Ciborinia camelliae]|nr:hypothetical protein NHQ30_009800 [Ciborinia camelliae]